MKQLYCDVFFYSRPHEIRHAANAGKLGYFSLGFGYECIFLFVWGLDMDIKS